MGSDKSLSARISTIDTLFTFTVQPKIKASALFEQLVLTLGLRETWYFGLRFKDELSGRYKWLDDDTKISKQGIKVEPPNKINLELAFKYYPDNVDKDLIQLLTIKLFYLQIKKEVLGENIYCPSEKAVLLASYYLQVKYGDFDPSIHVPGYFSGEELLPADTLKKHKLSNDEWEEKVVGFFRDHAGLDKEEAMLEYCKVAQGLEMYGVTYFPVSNAKSTDVYVGIDAFGINVYEKDNRLVPKIVFPWSEIYTVTHSKKKFNVRLMDINFIGKCDNPKEIYDLCIGNQNMYGRRRKPDSVEMQQMKAQRAEEKESRKSEKEKYLKELNLRKELEKENEEVRIRFDKMSEENKEVRHELAVSRKRIEELEKLLSETIATRSQLESEQIELKAMIEKWKESEEMEKVQKEELITEIRLKEDEVNKMRKAVEEKEEKSIKLREEIVTITESLEEAEKRPIPEPLPRTVQIKPEDDNKEEESEAPKISVSFYQTTLSGEEKSLEISKSDLMKELKEKLENTRNIELETEEDRIYRQNLYDGKEKFITLKEIRKGTIKRKIETFEAL